jgi:phage FluMu protein Com
MTYTISIRCEKCNERLYEVSTSLHEIAEMELSKAKSIASKHDCEEEDA